MNSISGDNLRTVDEGPVAHGLGPIFVVITTMDLGTP